MKRTLLESLKGLSRKEAEVAVTSAGLEPHTVENGEAIAMAAMPNTVILWLDDRDCVTVVTAGDPLELE